MNNKECRGDFFLQIIDIFHFCVQKNSFGLCDLFNISRINLLPFTKDLRLNQSIRQFPRL